jgi:phage terminase large subunit-like protein
MGAMSRQELEQLLKLLEEKAARKKANRYKEIFAALYPWQREYIEATASYSQCCLIAANRIGKTWVGTYLDAIHALGDYPSGWIGHAFDHAPLIWCLGYSGEKTRDLLQAALVGRKRGSSFEGSLIPACHIKGHESMNGTPSALRTLYVRQVGGGDVQAGDSKIQFWSYSQGQHALMGDAVDWFHVDEEPEDPEIFPQVLVRTASGDRGKGGRGILTFTPENGRTELVIQFMDNPSKAQFCMQKGWDDAPHLSDKVKEELLASFPPHQREMRTKGVPMLGHGRIFDIAEDDVTCAPFDVPPHFRVIDGMDFGWDHPQSQVQLAIDTENDAIYVTKVWKKSRVSPIEAWGATKAWSAGVPTAWPLDGLQTEKGSGKQQKAYYVEAGFTLLPEHATWPDGSNGVEAGLFEIRDLMLKGKFKIFRGLRDLLDEFLQYHRDENGKIVKVRDDALDAMRYAYMMRRKAIAFGDLGRPKKQVVVVNNPTVSPFRSRK